MIDDKELKELVGQTEGGILDDGLGETPEVEQEPEDHADVLEEEDK